MTPDAPTSGLSMVKEKPQKASKPEKKDGYPRFKLPDSYPVPEGLEEGGEWEVTVTLRDEGGGMVCAKTVDGVPLAEGEEMEEEQVTETETETETEAPAPATMAQAVAAQKAAGQPTY